MLLTPSRRSNLVWNPTRPKSRHTPRRENARAHARPTPAGRRKCLTRTSSQPADRDQPRHRQKVPPAQNVVSGPQDRRSGSGRSANFLSRGYDPGARLAAARFLRRQTGKAERASTTMWLPDDSAALNTFHIGQPRRLMHRDKPHAGLGHRGLALLPCHNPRQSKPGSPPSRICTLS